MRPLMQNARKAAIAGERIKSSIIFDPDLQAKGKGVRERMLAGKGLSFKEEGDVARKVELEKKREVARELGITFNEEEAIGQIEGSRKHLKPLDRIPEVEPWDKVLLLDGQKSFNAQGTTDLADF